MDQTDGDDGVLCAGGQRRGSVQDTVQLGEAAVVQSAANEGVLHDGVKNVVLAQLGTQSRILRDGDALVVHEDAGGSALQTLHEFGDDGLFLAQDFCVRHFGVSPPVNRITRSKKLRGRLLRSEKIIKLLDASSAGITA